MSVKRILDEEIKDELNELKKVELGSEAHKLSVDAVSKLLDKKIELERLEFESAEKRESREIENEMKAQQMKDEKQDRYIKNGLTAVSTVGGLSLAAWAFVASMNFEKTGIISTEGGRAALKKLLKF